MTGERILLVEDEDMIRSTLAEVLDEEGFEVTEAASGDRALVLVDQAPVRFDLLFTDIHMPGATNGLQLAEAVRRRQPDIPVLFVTGRPDVLEGARLDAASILLRKPYGLREVVEVLRRLLDAPGQDR